MKKNYFVSVDEAKAAIKKTVKVRQVIERATKDASGFVLAKTVKSKYPSPPFDQSAMDGYAFLFKDYEAGKTILIVGEAAAGKNYTGKLKSGQAVRIFTGACIPAGADCVVMQEKVSVTDAVLKIQDKDLVIGKNIRRAGSQLNKNETAIEAGTLLNPGSVGFIASLGTARIHVYRKPVLSIIVTGNELTEPGKSLLPGHVYESNSVSLEALLRNDGIQDISVLRARDTFSATLKAFKKALLKSDFILFTGGISVGDYDYVEKVLNESGVKTVFYKVRQKPGKPLYFGTIKNKLVFGIPGNPASVLCCYYEYVRPSLRLFQNHPQPFGITMQLPLHNVIHKKAGLTQFLKAYTDFRTVTVLPGQESYIMKSFVSANCQVVLSETDEDRKAGSPVEIHLF